MTPTSAWQGPGKEPQEVGEYNVTVFDPEINRTANPMMRTFDYRRWWDGVEWSLPYLLTHKPAVRKLYASEHTMLRGDDARFWWRGVVIVNTPNLCNVFPLSTTKP